MKALHAHWAQRVHFLEVVIRQAHPGPDEPPYRSFEEKFRDAEAYQRAERLPWTLLVDDLQGRVHQAYGGLADPTYLIGTDGRVAFYNMWTSVPRLYEAISTLLEQGGSGVVADGLDRGLHLFPALVDGWRALARGLPQSFTDMMIAAPGMSAAVWLGYQLRPILAPLALRARPVPAGARAALAAGAVLTMGLTVWAASRPRRRRRGVIERLGPRKTRHWS
jgi:hypothetical protein